MTTNVLIALLFVLLAGILVRDRLRRSATHAGSDGIVAAVLNRRTDASPARDDDAEWADKIYSMRITHDGVHYLDGTYVRPLDD